jgi:plastocyanin
MAATSMSLSKETTMSVRGVFVLALVGSVSCGVAHVATAADWGDLKGQFIYDGTPPKPAPLQVDKEPACKKHQPFDESLVVNEKNKGLANVVIFVSTKKNKLKINPDLEKEKKDTAILDNKDCRFSPHILAMEVSQTLEILNSDGFSHNSNVTVLGEEGINPLLGPGNKATYKFAKAQRLPVSVNCNIHGWMKGYVVVKDNPYMAVTDEDGNFEIKDLPVGELEFTAWQENAGYLNAKPDWKKGVFKLKIKKGDNDLKTIKVAPKLLVKK